MGVLDDAIREHLELKRRHGAAEEDLRRQEEEALGPARREVAPADADDVDGDQPVAAEQEAPAEAGERTVASGEASLVEEAQADEPALPEDQPELALAEDAEPSGPEAGLTDQAEPSVVDREPPRRTEEAAPPEAHDLEDEHESLAAEPPQSGVEDAPLDEAPAAHDPAGQETALYDVAEHLAQEEEAAGSEFDDEDEDGERQIGDTPPRGFESLDDDELVGDDEEPAEEDADVLEDTPDFLQETPEHDRLWFEQKPPRDFDFD